jgi:hypothetical protein
MASLKWPFDDSSVWLGTFYSSASRLKSLKYSISKLKFLKNVVRRVVLYQVLFRTGTVRNFFTIPLKFFAVR